MPAADKIAQREAGTGVLMLLSALMAFGSIATDMYLPALPSLGAALHAGRGEMELTISAYLAGFCLGQLLWGPIGDRYGRRLPVALGLVLFIAGSVGCALSATAGEMIGWRVLQAIGGCAGPVLARAVVRDLYVRERSAQMLSRLILVMAVAPLLGPIVGGQIMAVWSWRGIFWVLAALGSVALATLPMLPETLPPARRSQDTIGRSLIAYGQLLRHRRVLGYALAGGFFYGGIFAYIAGTPFAYIDYHHVPARAYGFLFGVAIVAIMIVNLINAKLVMRIGSNRLFLLGTAIAALAGIAAALDARFGWGGLAGLVTTLVIYTSVSGLIVANSVAGALAAFPGRAGITSALVGAIHYGAGILSAAMVGWFADGTPWPMGWIIGIGGIGTWVAATLLTREKRPAR